MICKAIKDIKSELPSGTELVAVSKFHPVQAIIEAYDAGQRIFAESRPQEFASKVPLCPTDIQWHFIGHLQTNKLKLVLPYASLIQSVDSVHLLEAMEKWAESNAKTVNILLEAHVAKEETKSGFLPEELESLTNNWNYPCLHLKGLMGMASLTEDESVIRGDFSRLRDLFEKIRANHPDWKEWRVLSIGMSSDWRIAIDYGATMVRIGTAIFGQRNY